MLCFYSFVQSGWYIFIPASHTSLTLLPRPAPERHARVDAGSTPAEVRARRKSFGVIPAFKRVDTCAAEFEAATPYLYSSYDGSCECEPTTEKKVLILGAGPNRIGQGIEFDYCCCHASFALRWSSLLIADCCRWSVCSAWLYSWVGGRMASLPGCWRFAPPGCLP